MSYFKAHCNISLVYGLNKEASGVDNSLASSRRMRLLIPSGPTALPTGSVQSTALTSSEVNTRELNGSFTIKLSIAGSVTFSSSNKV